MSPPAEPLPSPFHGCSSPTEPFPFAMPTSLGILIPPLVGAMSDCQAGEGEDRSGLVCHVGAEEREGQVKDDVAYSWARTATTT
jgi:hypothetical protein